MNHKKVLFLIAFITVFITAIEGQTSPEYKILFEKAKFTMETKGDLNGAINLFNEIIKKYPKEREYAAKSQLYIGLCYEKLGVKEAQKAFQKVVSSYPEQTETVRLANEKLSILKKTETTAKNTEITIRRVMSGPKAIDIGGPSPDGRYLSFTDWETRDVSVHDLVTGQNRHITKNTTGNNPGDRYDYPDGSIFSGDGKQIAYCWWIDDKEDKEFYGEIRTIALDGSGERVIYRSKENFPSRLDWSADGKLILTKLNERPALIAVEDGSVQYLPVENPGMMCFSPDNDYIAYDAPQSGETRKNDVYVYELTTQRTSLLVQHPAEDRLLGWSPDGRHVLFVSDRRGSLDAWLIPVSGGQPRGEPILVASNMSKRSGRVGFTQTGAFFFSGNAGGQDIFLTRLGQTGKLLSPPVEVTGSNLGSNWGPDFSRDGKSLAYFTDQNEIVIQSLETREKRVIKPSPDITRSEIREILRWAPDGRSLIVTGADGQGKEGFLRVNVLSGEASLLFKPTHKVFPLIDLSPDGKKIFSIYPLFVWDSESGEEKKLASRDMVSLAVSPDGGQLAFLGFGDVGKPGGLYVMPSTGGSPKLLVEAKDRRGLVAWSPDGSQLYYALPSEVSGDGTPATLRSELWRVPSQGGEPQQLGLTVDGMMFSLRVHPDGQRIVYGRLQSNPEIWVMENFLPEIKIEDKSLLTLKKLDYPHLDTPFARLSPDGSKLAYVVYSGNLPKRIDILDIGSGKEKVMVESGAGRLSDFVWSPQCDKIAYTSDGKELHIRNINGSDSHMLLKDSLHVLYPTDWSRDGGKIVCFFEGDDQKVKIGTVTSTGQVKFLISGNSTEFHSEPKISPDGNFIAFSQGLTGGNTDIFILSTDGNEKIRVTNHPGRDENPVWSPDGRYLLFLSDRNRSVDLWCSLLKKGKPVGTPFIIKNDIGWRSRIYDFTASGKLFMLMLGGAEPANLFTIPVDQISGNLNGPVTPISVYPTDHYFPRYSTDGKKIAYLSRKGQISLPKLFVLNEKGAEQELPLQGYDVVNVAWHPGNQSLIFAGWDKEYNAGIFEISLEKEEIKTIYSGEKVDLRAQKGGLGNILFLPNTGKLIFSRGMGKGRMDALTCDPDGQNLAVVFPGLKTDYWSLTSPAGEHICYRTGDSLMIVSVSDRRTSYIGAYTPRLEATWSPNSESLMYRQGSSLKMFSLTGNASRTLYEAPAGKTIGGMEIYSPSWSPDGNRFIFTERDTSAISTARQKLILLNPGNGSVKQLGEVPDGYQLSELRWSPDGSKVMATGRSISSTKAQLYNYWVMENFLPK